MMAVYVIGMGARGREGLSLEALCDPGALRPGEDLFRRRLVFSQGPEVQVERVGGVAGLALGIQLHVEHASGNHAPLPGAGGAGVLNGVLQVGDDAGLVAWVAVVHQDRAPAQEVAVALQDEIQHSV